jgi:hypothetical protein
MIKMQKEGLDQPKKKTLLQPIPRLSGMALLIQFCFEEKNIFFIL